MAKKKPIKDLLDREVEKPVLEKFYLSYAIATDQLRRCPEILRAIADGFERVTSKRLDPGTLLRYMLNRRKDSDWPKLGEKAKRFSLSLLDLLPSNFVSILKEIYVRLDIPLDEYLFRRKLVRELESQFASATRTSESGDVLVAVMMAFRKRGLWPTIREATPEKLRPFGDIDEVVRRHASAS